MFVLWESAFLGQPEDNLRTTWGQPEDNLRRHSGAASTSESKTITVNCQSPGDPAPSLHTRYSRRLPRAPRWNSAERGWASVGFSSTDPFLSKFLTFVLSVLRKLPEQLPAATAYPDGQPASDLLKASKNVHSNVIQGHKYVRGRKTAPKPAHGATADTCDTVAPWKHRRLVPRWHCHAQLKSSENFLPISPSSRQVAFSSSSLVTCVIIDGEWSIRSVTQGQGRYRGVKVVPRSYGKTIIYILPLPVCKRAYWAAK